MRRLGRVGLGQVEHPLRDRRAVGARVELRGEVPQRQVELGREDEHGQRGLEAEVALGEADPDHDRNERDPERRRELQHGSREEGGAERPHRRAAVGVADLDDPLRLGAPAVERPEGR